MRAYLLAFLRYTIDLKKKVNILIQENLIKIYSDILNTHKHNSHSVAHFYYYFIINI